MEAVGVDIRRSPGSGSAEGRDALRLAGAAYRAGPRADGPRTADRHRNRYSRQCAPSQYPAVLGEAGHSGAVPRWAAHDALFAAAELLTRMDRHWAAQVKQATIW